MFSRLASISVFVFSPQTHSKAMKRRASPQEAGGSMLKYRKDDVDWTTVCAQTQARLMRSQATFSFGHGFGNVSLPSPSTPTAFPHHALTQQAYPQSAQQPLHPFFAQVFPSLAQQQQIPQPLLHHSPPSAARPIHQEPCCAHCATPASQAPMSYLSTQSLVACHFCERLACGECYQLCSKCEDVFCRGCLVPGYNENEGVCLTCRF
ncbi:hypothetical protein BC830DRAFT_1151865 [Chytriomyces sp. MP71]|nr:hypothetical protein BC830DRAFT_1151865 [Chytriomyces sp. MP71]